METIGQNRIWSFPDDDDPQQGAHNESIRQSPGHIVNSFYELAKKVAELQFRNPSYVLLFRGQGHDHRENELTSLKPRIFRSRDNQGVDEYHQSLVRKFRRLEIAEALLADKYNEWVGRLGNKFVRRVRIVRWAILQHYEVCHTPLLDLTHSLRVAASFATKSSDAEVAFIYVLGVPHLTGAVTVTAESGIQLVRLASVCPPTAMRPHLQEGYLIGEYPDLDKFDQKSLYQIEEVDFARRLIAKIRFNPSTFWKPDDFPMIPKDALSREDEQIIQLTQKIHNAVYDEVPRLP